MKFCVLGNSCTFNKFKKEQFSSLEEKECWIEIHAAGTHQVRHHQESRPRDPCHTDQHNPDYFLRYATIRNPDREIPATLINTIRITSWGMPPSGIQTERSLPHWSTQSGLLLEVCHHQESRPRDPRHTDQHNPDYFLRYATIRNPDREIHATLINTIRITYWVMPPSGIQIERSLPHWSTQSGLLLEVCHHQESKVWFPATRWSPQSG